MLLKRVYKTNQQKFMFFSTTKLTLDAFNDKNNWVAGKKNIILLWMCCFQCFRIPIFFQYMNSIFIFTNKSVILFSVVQMIFRWNNVHNLGSKSICQDCWKDVSYMRSTFDACVYVWVCVKEWMSLLMPIWYDDCVYELLGTVKIEFEPTHKHIHSPFHNAAGALYTRNDKRLMMKKIQQQLCI